MYADDEFNLYGDFRDHIADNSIQEGELIPAGKTSFLGNRCELEVLSHQHIDKLQGLSAGVARKPTSPATEAQKAAVRSALIGLGLISV